MIATKKKSRKNKDHLSLRIGNLVKCPAYIEGYTVIQEIGFSDEQRGYYARLEGVSHGVWFEIDGKEFIHGVPINEYILIDMCFEKNEMDEGHYYFLPFSRDRYCDIGIISGDQFASVNLFPYEETFSYSFVHEVQNLYHAITGNELYVNLVE